MSYLGSKIIKSEIIDDNFSHTIYAGIGFLNDRNKKYLEIDGMKPYMRIAKGWATTSNLNDILTGNTIEDKYNNQLTSLFYGHPIAKELFNQPIEVYLSAGVVYHHSSVVQDTTLELDFEFKPYYTLPLSFVDIRLGAGAGLSYIQDVTYIEKLDGEAKGYKMSNINFFLDLSADINLGFVDNSLDDIWIGTAIHHRSSVFESSSLFGRIKGGSNYNTIYLQWHF
jgi:outer membrane protein